MFDPDKRSLIVSCAFLRFVFGWDDRFATLVTYRTAIEIHSWERDL